MPVTRPVGSTMIGERESEAMSYCRWSSYNGECDVYVYAGGAEAWVTHVRGLRHPVGGPPTGTTALFENGFDHQAYKTAQARRAAWERRNPAVKIDHPSANQSFQHSSPGACAENLKRLKADGLLVPDSVIEELLEEQAELDEEDEQ